MGNKLLLCCGERPVESYVKNDREWNASISCMHCMRIAIGRSRKSVEEAAEKAENEWNKMILEDLKK